MVIPGSLGIELGTSRSVSGRANTYYKDDKVTQITRLLPQNTFIQSKYSSLTKFQPLKPIQFCKNSSGKY